MMGDIMDISKTLGFNPRLVPPKAGNPFDDDDVFGDRPRSTSSSAFTTAPPQFPQGGKGYEDFGNTDESIPMVLYTKDQLEQLRSGGKMPQWERRQRKKYKDWQKMQQHQQQQQQRVGQMRQQQWQQQQLMQRQGRFGFNTSMYSAHPNNYQAMYQEMQDLPTEIPANIKKLGKFHPLYKQWKDYLTDVTKRRSSFSEQMRRVARESKPTVAQQFMKNTGMVTPSRETMSEGVPKITELSKAERGEKYDEFLIDTEANRSCIVATKDQCDVLSSRDDNPEDPSKGTCYWDKELSFCFPKSDKGRQLFLDDEPRAKDKRIADAPQKQFKENRIARLRELKQDPEYLLTQLLGTYVYELSKYPYKNMLDQYVLITMHDCISKHPSAMTKNASGSKGRSQLLTILKSNVYMRTNMMKYCDGRRSEGCIGPCYFHKPSAMGSMFSSGTCDTKAEETGYFETAIEQLKNSVEFIKRFATTYISIPIIMSLLACTYGAYKIGTATGDGDSLMPAFMTTMLANLDFSLTGFLGTSATGGSDNAAAIAAKQLEDIQKGSQSGSDTSPTFGMSIGTIVGIIFTLNCVMAPLISRGKYKEAARTLCGFTVKYAGVVLKGAVANTAITFIYNFLTSGANLGTAWTAASATIPSLPAMGGIGTTIGAVGASIMGAATAAGGHITGAAAAVGGLLSTPAWLSLLSVLLAIAAVYLAYRFYKQVRGGDAIIEATMAMNTVGIAGSLGIDIVGDDSEESPTEGEDDPSQMKVKKELSKRIEYPTMQALSRKLVEVLKANNIDTKGIVENYEFNMLHESKKDRLMESFESLALLVDVDGLKGDIMQKRSTLAKTFNNVRYQQGVKDGFSGFLGDSCVGTQFDSKSVEDNLGENPEDE